MHLIVPFAAPLSDAGRHALQTLKLPHLDELLRRFTPGERDDGDAMSFSPPHERAQARALGLAGADGELPWAAVQAARDGVDTGDLAWGLLTPVHWEVASDHIRLTDPAALQLDDASSRTLFDAVHSLFEEEGAALVYGGAERWYVAHESLHGLATASLDRVIGRSIEPWLPSGASARLVRRLQNEVQMLLFTHPVNAEREAGDLLPVNSFWLSGCGLRQRVQPLPPPRIDQRLRGPALAEDWGAWMQAWRALDAELPGLLAGVHTLVLCGERSAVQYHTQPRPFWQRLQGTLRGASTVALLESL